MGQGFGFRVLWGWLCWALSLESNGKETANNMPTEISAQNLQTSLKTKKAYTYTNKYRLPEGCKTSHMPTSEVGDPCYQTPLP